MALESAPGAAELSEDKSWELAASLANKFVEDHAVRQQDLTLHVGGKGQYKKWIPSACLRAAFGWSTISALKHSKHLADRSVTSMSLQSVAYWMKASPSFVAEVQHAASQFFMKGQKIYCEAILQSEPLGDQAGLRVGRLNIEFDETSQMQRVRFGVNFAHAVFSVLVQRTTLLASKGNGPVKFATFLTAPAALRKTHSGGIWTGITSKQPVHPFRWARAFDIFILAFVSDAAPANMKLMRWIGRNLPPNTLFLHHICNMHEANHCVQGVWRGLGINPMFCLSNVITFGQTFMDLMLSAIAVIKSRLVIVYDPPDPSARKFATEIMNMSLMQWDNTHEPGDLKKRRRDRIALFLNVFNSDWRNNREIKHHCSVFCACGGASRSNLADLAASLFVEVILFGRPPIPALSRWTKCWKTAMWYLPGLVCHGIFQASFLAMFRRKGRESGDSKGTLQMLLNGILRDLAGGEEDALVLSQKPEEAASASFTASEIPVVKVQGVRSEKSCLWLEREETVTEVLVAVVSTPNNSPFRLASAESA